MASVANTAVYGGLDNTVGLSITRDFGDFVPTLGYDHQNFIANSSEYSYMDRGSELLSARAGFRLHPTVTAGLEANYQNTWSADLSYTDFFGAGRYNLINDRDFISFNVKYSF